MPKQRNDCKGYASPYNVDISNSFNPELQLNPIFIGLYYIRRLFREGGGVKLSPSPYLFSVLGIQSL